MRFELAVARLAILPAPLPAPADALMPTYLGPAGALPPWVPADRGPSRAAAVLVLLFPDEAGDARVVLTERVARAGDHSAEVSFPGGRAEAGDSDLAATALREAAEEVALDEVAAGVRVIGHLERCWIPVSNYEVTPVLALAERRPLLIASADEVARILLPRVADFLPDAPLEMVERTVRHWPIRYGAYRMDNLLVWGATARILNQLGAVLGGE
jgi:8-oxo-dGTP pyrophosphatase MutT (NUDIX family)